MNAPDPAPPATSTTPHPSLRPAPSPHPHSHAQVLQRTLTALRRRLPALTTHTTDDPALALLDSWATVADVVAFYQQRIAAEGYLSTATEHRSVLELARTVGYEPAPGAAATTHLSFTVEDAADTSAAVVVPAGTRVQSIPGQNESPQTFETCEEITALAERNAVPLRLREPQRLPDGSVQLRLTGVTGGLRPGDLLLFRAPGAGHGDEDEPWQARTLTAVEPRLADGAQGPADTVVHWAEPLRWDGHAQGAGPDEVEVHVFRQPAAVFGHNAPDWRLMPPQVQEGYLHGTTPHDTSQWPGFALTDPPDGAQVIELDTALPQLAPGSWLLMRAPAETRQPGAQELFQIVSADVTAAADFGLTATTTRVHLKGHGRISSFDRRTTRVHTQSERLDLPDVPIAEPVTGAELLLDRPVGLPQGATVLVTGRTPDGRPYAAAALVAHAEPTGSGTRLTLTEPLGASLDRASVRVLGNVVAATAGETVTDEVLGSGDGTAVHQRFTLLHRDLTHVPAPTGGGVRDTLEVEVDHVRWVQTGSLYRASPHDRCYAVRIDDEGRAAVLFGDGRHGARLPSGQDNVRARYRSGIGPEGNVRAGTLTLLQTRPLGIRGVDNPLAATGGTAPQPPADTRIAVPLSVRAPDRLVSLTDHEDFARAFAGIARAAAVRLPDGPRPLLHLTVAGTGGAPLSGTALADLRAALAAAAPGELRVQVADHRRLEFTVAVALLTDPDRSHEDVAREVRDLVAAQYSFDRRSFAQPVTASEILALVHRSPGVLAATLTALHPATATAGVAAVLTAASARPGPQGPTPAALLLTTPDLIRVTEMMP